MIKQLLPYFLVISMVWSLPKVAAANDPQKTSDEEAVLNEFKDTKFLQIDKLDVPKELTRIEEQIRQNALDVIISSKTHTPVYAQKRETGYSDSYKKFHGLEIQIVPIPNEQDFYSLTFFYYNWTNRKFDKRLRKRISKYNVLNELRFGLYELLLGKKFVNEHKDEIEKQNYDRILAVRESELIQSRMERRKRKLENQKKDEEQLRLQQKEENKKKSRLSRGELEKKEKQMFPPLAPISLSNLNVNADEMEIEEVDIEDGTQEIAEAEKSGETILPSKKKLKRAQKSSSAPLPAVPTALASTVLPAATMKGESIPSVSSLYAFASFFDDSITSDGLLHTSTHLKYLGIGAKYVQEQQTARPRGLRFTLKTGLPIKTDSYDFPVYRSFEAEIYKRKLLGHFELIGGLDFSPLYFVNLANPGEGLAVFENDIFWLKAGVGLSYEFSGNSLDLRAVFLKSLLAKSNQNKSLEGTSLALNLQYMQASRHGVEASYKKSEFVGDVNVASDSIMFSYIYKFEN